MNYLLTILLLLVISQANFIKEVNRLETDECDQIQFQRPEIFIVEGKATASVPPTMVYLNLGIDIKDKLADGALTRVSKITQQAKQSLQSANTSNAMLKITTTQFSLFPYVDQKYNKNSQQYEVIDSGFQVHNTLLIETENLEIVGKLIDLAVQSGVTNVNSVSFDVKPEEKAQIKEDLLKQAIENAKHKAQIVLDSLNMKIHSIKSVSFNDYLQPMRPMQMFAKNADMEMAAGSASTEVFAQDQSISQTIQVGFVVVKKDE